MIFGLKFEMEIARGISVRFLSYWAGSQSILRTSRINSKMIHVIGFYPHFYRSENSTIIWHRYFEILDTENPKNVEFASEKFDHFARLDDDLPYHTNSTRVRKHF